MMMSSAALLDIFCVTNQYSEAGQINLNTAPPPVLRALAASIPLRSDQVLLLSTSDQHGIGSGMAEAFAQGVMRFRSRYPFFSPSQLAFIGTDPGWPNTNTWPANAVFGNTNSIYLDKNVSNNISGGTTSIGISAWNDGAAEEWFGSLYGLTTTYSRNFRCYVIAQLVDSNKVGKGPVMRKYYNIITRNNTDASTDTVPSSSTFNTYEARY